MNACPLHEHQCDDCGRYFWTRQNGGYAYLCDECRDERRRERDRVRYAQKCGHHKENGFYIRVVKDPDILGGFPRGASLSDVDLKYGIKMRTFTPGTILLINGVRAVIELINGKQQVKMEA